MKWKTQDAEPVILLFFSFYLFWLELSQDTDYVQHPEYNFDFQIFGQNKGHIPFNWQVLLNEWIVELQKLKGSSSFDFPTHLLQYNLFHSHQVWNREPVLAYSNQVSCQWDISFLFYWFYSQIEAAQPNTPKVFGLYLKRQYAHVFNLFQLKKTPKKHKGQYRTQIHHYNNVSLRYKYIQLRRT